MGITTMVDLNTLAGRRIHQLRRGLEWSQADLAQRLGVSRVTVSHMETGAVNLTLDRLEEVAKALGVNCVFLMGYQEMDKFARDRQKIVEALRFLRDNDPGRPVFEDEM